MPKRPVLWSLILAAIPLLGWWTYGLFDLDEGFYAAVTAEMNRRSEWITPYFNGKPWFEKPILLYWLAKPSLAIFGEMVGPRLPSILATLGLYGLVAWFCRRRFGEATATLAVLILGSSLLVVGAGRMMLTDPLLNLCLAGAFLTFWESLVGHRRWRLLTAALLGFGVLAKGPVAILLFVPIAAWTYWREKELRPAFRGEWPLGTLVLFAVVATWYVPAYLANGHVFVQKFLIEQNIGRFTGGDQAHTVRGLVGLIFYVPILLLGFFPWSLLLFGALFSPTGRNSPERRSEEAGSSTATSASTPQVSSFPNPLPGAPERYLWTWSAVIFLFFTISGAKLVHYILPCFPPLAILVASHLVGKWQTLTWRRLAWPIAWLAMVAAIAQAGFSVYYYGYGEVVAGPHAEVHALARYVREHAAPGDIVAEYRMSRREKSLGTGGPKIQETSHPSTLLYLDRDVIDTDDWNVLLAQKAPVWILTRWNRVDVAEQSAAKGRLQEVATPVKQDLYRVWLLKPTD